MTPVDVDKNIQSIDYKTMSLESLIAELNTKLNQHTIPEIKEEANAIRASFYYQYNEALETSKKEFFEKEGEDAVFEYDKQSVQVSFKNLWKQYLEKKNEYHQKIAKELTDNLAKKEAIIDQIKVLVDQADVSNSYKEFKQLQEDWKNVGAIVSDKYQETWGNYHLYVEQFYDLLHINNDLRQIDFKHNLEAKQQIIVKAKELLEHADIQFAFNELQVLHKIWKEETGPVAKEFREPVWEEFTKITNEIHDKKTAFYNALRKQEEENLSLKLTKIEEIKNFDYSKNKSFGDWKKSIEKFEALKESFLDIGKVPKANTNETWELFKEATKKFNSAKNDFFKEAKKEQGEALMQKEALIKEAQQWKDSEDFEQATENFKRIQAAWKKVGFVPRKQADALWKEFKSLCDAYFDRLNLVKLEGTPQEQENLKDKEAFLEKIKPLEITESNYGDIVKEWLAIGTVPSQKNKIDQDIQTVVLSVLNSFDDKEKADLIKYKTKIAYWSAIDSKKLYDEQSNLRKEIDQITKDLKQLENNLGFFANSKKGNPLLDTALKSIENETNNLKQAKLKMKFLRSLN
ncbi:DUF349 domain-containing protein [Wenyingzhuangia sp. IMCC45533]